MKLFLTTTILALAVTGSALADAAAGKAVYTANCDKCHGADGAGKAVIAKMLNATMKPLASPEVKAQSDAVLAKDITAGIGKMKPVKITDAQVTDVIAYVRTLK
ncbi:MAG: cytochrome c [Bryobacteraceae bacterium]|jgi:mono/diheme cytochrome c family protein